MLFGRKGKSSLKTLDTHTAAFPEGGFVEGGLRGWLAFAACGGLT